ncbi:MAG TPA: glycosyltransferase family 1 protein [Methylomirabilota bacterium]|jgi:glycosyltransferase involved in cell wall biosynthesis|nr:glycosyltransferase family 1 protein [Methylomirabilota bacterium]
MRIGINLIPLRPGRMGGAEVYFRDLLAALLERGGHEYVLVTADYNHETLPPDSSICRRLLFVRRATGIGRGFGRLAGAVARLRGALRELRGQYRRHVPGRVQDWRSQPLARVARALERALGWARGKRGRLASDSLRDLMRRERIDLWFCPFTNLEPRVCPVPAVITVFDLQHEYHPEFFDVEELRHRRHFYPESCAAADHVIAISEFTRRCVIERYGVEPERVSAIPLAAGSDFDWRGAAAGVTAIRHQYALPSRYVLYPANTWRHKNHARLIEALALYRRAHADDLTLVLTGVGKEGQADLERAIDGHGLTGLVRMLGYVPRADLPALYAGAACLVLPSLFEGFGIPLVEAMLVGCPVAAADVTSIPEVAGDAGVLFDPLDPADICRALAAIVGDPARAAELRRRGRARAERFSVSRTADLTLAVFERVVREYPAHAPDARQELLTTYGVYDDRWMGAEAVFSIRGRSVVSCEIDGHLPGFAPIVPQRLAVRVGLRDVLAIPLTDPGPFTLSVPLDSNGTTAGRWEISLVPSRTFRPRAYGMSADDRELSVQLVRLRARTEDGRQIVKLFGSGSEESR